jgi:hypothetical protein
MVARPVVEPLDSLPDDIESLLRASQAEGHNLVVGRALVLALVDHARATFQRVRLRTTTPEGTAFYLAIGFEPIDELAGTHQIVF